MTLSDTLSYATSKLHPLKLCLPWREERNHSDKLFIKPGGRPSHSSPCQQPGEAVPASAVVSAWALCQRFKFLSPLPALGVYWRGDFLEGQRPKHSKCFPREGAWLFKRGSLQGLLKKGLQSSGPGGSWGEGWWMCLGCSCRPHVASASGGETTKGTIHSFIHSFLLLVPSPPYPGLAQPKPSGSNACVW